MSYEPEQVLAIGPFSEEETKGLRAEFGARLLPGPDALRMLDPQARAAVTALAYKGHTEFGASAMEALPQLGLIANFGVGFDAIDVAAAQARGIAVTNTPDVLNDDVADLAVALTLAQFRKLAQGDAWVRDGRWAAQGAMPLSRKLSGRPVGILGLGRVGHEIASRFAAFKMPVHYWSRQRKDTPAGWTWHETPETLAAAVEVLVVAVVGGPETTNMVDARVLAALGPRGVLVNISRGSTMDETALIRALRSGQIAGAALDVFASEPVPDPELTTFDTVALYPHGGSATHETRSAMAALQRANIRAYLAKAPLPSPVT